MNIFLGFGVLLCAILAPTALAGREIVEVEGGGGLGEQGNFDKSAVYSPNYCFTKDKQCTGEHMSSMFEVSANGCAATCTRIVDCGSAFYSADKICYLRYRRCTADELVPAKGLHLYRLKIDEECAPETGEPLVTAKQYGNKFCRLRGFRCPTKGLAGGSMYKQPQRFRPWESCLLKCANAKTCTGVDYYEGEKKACDVRNEMCADEDLVADHMAENYIRLKATEDQCPDDREEVVIPECKKK